MKSALREEANDRFLELLSQWEKFLAQEECMEEKDVRKIYEGLLFMIGEGTGVPGGEMLKKKHRPLKRSMSSGSCRPHTVPCSRSGSSIAAIWS